MSRIKGKNTKPEMLLRTFLHANGYRYKLQIIGQKNGISISSGMTLPII
jgi:G:T-mismatch repair DNA endonuclease (very short patch repair protein)